MRKLREEFKHDYPTPVQLHLLRHLLSDADTFARCRRIIQDDYFDDQLSPTVRFILTHADTFHAIPDSDLIKAKTGVHIATYSPEEAKQKLDWFLKEFEAFCRHRAMENIILDGIDLLRAGQMAEIERRIKEAMTISLISELGTDYYDNPEERLRRLIDNSHKISTGWGLLDNLLYGGFGRGGLNLFLGNSGVGKSLVLQNLSLNWSLGGYNGIYFSLELSEDETCLKMDAMLTGQGTRDIVRSISDTAFRVAIKGKQAGRLTIKRLPENGTNTNDLYAYLKEYEISTGIKPDFIVVDYMDLLVPNNTKIDPSNLFVKDKFVSEELRALMHITNTFGATAGQLNRGSLDAEGDFNHSHVSGGISKINTSDNVFGIFAPPHFKEKGEFELLCLKARSSAAVNKRIRLGYDPTSMRLTDSIGQMDKVDRPTAPEALRQEVNSPAVQIQNGFDALLSDRRRKSDHL